MSQSILCSTIIATVGRPSLGRSVDSVLDQALSDKEHELIVVNDSGRPLSAGAWQDSSKAHLIETDRRERCVARNSGAAQARGKYLQFLDDDDYILPGGLSRLIHRSEESMAQWICGGTQLVDRTGRFLLQLDIQNSGNCLIQVVAGEWIPLQSSLIERNLFLEVGGFNPSIVGAEDIDLVRRLALIAELSTLDQPVSCVGIGEEGSRTNRTRARGLSRFAREDVLDSPKAFRRMLESAADSAYWKGRIVRAYWTSALLNLSRRRFWTAGSRFCTGCAGLGLAVRQLSFPSFWKAVVRRHRSKAFAPSPPEALVPVDRKPEPLAKSG